MTRRVAVCLLAMAVVFPFRALADPPLIEVRQEAYGRNESEDGLVVSEVQAFVGETVVPTSDGGVERKTRQFGCLEIRKRTSELTSTVNHGCGKLTIELTDEVLGGARVSGKIESEVKECEEIPAGLEYCDKQPPLPATIEVTAEFTASEDPAEGAGLCSGRPVPFGIIPGLSASPLGIYRPVLSSWTLDSRVPPGNPDPDIVEAEESAPVVLKRTGVRSFYVDEIGLLTGNDDVGNPCLPQSSVSMPEL